MVASHIITLQNFMSKLPKWDPNEQNQLYAVVDMGSNGIRFSITSLEPPKSRLLTPVYASRAAISLFDSLTLSEDGDLIFLQETIDAVASALASFNRLIVLYNVPRAHTMVFATEAMRRASNATQMLKSIAEATDGLRVHILEPAVETLFGAVMGSRSGINQVHGALFLDLGGGSVQMTWVDTSLENYETESARAGKSMPFGAAKLTRVLEQETSTIQSAEVGNLRLMMANAYSNLCESFPKLRAIKTAHERGQNSSVDVYMCGGGFRGYGSMLMHHEDTAPYPFPSIGTYTVDGVTFQRASELRAANKSYDGKVFGMSRRRRSQFDAISTVIESFLDTVPNIRTVTFCKGSNRDGALMMLLPKTIRESNPLEVLANLNDNEKKWSLAVAAKLAEAVPEGVDLSEISTVFSEGLHALFTPQLWSRAGHESGSNTSYALHYTLSRDSDAPGLTHLGRATLALTLAARWGLNICPADLQLANGLRSILSRQHIDAVFWSQYIGAVANIVASILPVRPNSIDNFNEALRFKSKIVEKTNKRDRIHLSVILAPESLGSIHPSDIDNVIQGILKSGNDKSKKKVFMEISPSSSSSSSSSLSSSMS